MPNYKDQAGKLHFIDDVAFEHLLPAGCVQITDEDAAEIHAALVPKWSPDPLLKVAKAGREIALNRLAGIAFAARETGDSATVAACLAARQSLLDITKLPAVLAATDDASLTAAVGSGYEAIVLACPANIKGAFAGIQT